MGAAEQIDDNGHDAKWEAFAGFLDGYFRKLGIRSYPDPGTEDGRVSFFPVLQKLRAINVGPRACAAAAGRVAARGMLPRFADAAITALMEELGALPPSAMAPQAGGDVPIGAKPATLKDARAASRDCPECGGEGVTLRYATKPGGGDAPFGCYCHRCEAGRAVYDAHKAKAKPGERRTFVDLADPAYHAWRPPQGGPAIDWRDPIFGVPARYRTDLSIALAQAEEDRVPDWKRGRELMDGMRRRLAEDMAASRDKQTQARGRDLLATLKAARASGVRDEDVPAEAYESASAVKSQWSAARGATVAPLPAPAF